jgi:beta-galactosidase
MITRRIALLLLLACHLTARAASPSPRETRLLDNWMFYRGDPAGAASPDFDDSRWQRVTVPHDWAIAGPFSPEEDLQRVAVTQNMERAPTNKTGRTGGLPHVGVGWYRARFRVPAGARAVLLFDGAMSEARVHVNGREVCYWPNGYNAFHVDVTPVLAEGRENVVAVRLENKPRASRWYPGAGLYRDVRLVITGSARVPVWGTRVVTPVVTDSLAAVLVETTVEGRVARLVTAIHDGDGRLLAVDTLPLRGDTVVQQSFTINNPGLWSPEAPRLHEARARLYAGDTLLDEYRTRFGIRVARFDSTGFSLNGERRKFRGVCNHHDLGPLGAAVNRSALRHRLALLKDMGCDAVRTAHNMPSEALVDLCDEMGFMMIIEAFDEWDVAKCENGYHRFFREWAERDLVNMVRHFRSRASVVLWSIGNEVPSQTTTAGRDVARYLRDICHREDSTRPVTCGIDQVDRAIANGFAATLDVAGFNYRVHRYTAAREYLPMKIVLGTETASTVSSRGVYKFPVERRANAVHDDHQSSSYDVEHCHWSNLPDDDFALADDHDWTVGQFVWTGFDYLGEPTPYDTDAWPSHSSLFGIIDLASLPKDRFWLYRARWNDASETLHVLPHWTWPGREGLVTPVFVYTSYYEVELFVNGKSQGTRRTGTDSVDDRYRARWTDVVYEPGELRVVARDANGVVRDERVTRTAGEPRRVELVPARDGIAADGRDLVYVTARVVDADGNLCPFDDRLATFRVTGGARFRAFANGDPTCLDPFQESRGHFFSGELTLIVQSTGKRRAARVTVSADGLGSGSFSLPLLP